MSETSYDDGIDEGGGDSTLDDGVDDNGGEGDGGNRGDERRGEAANDISYLGELPEGIGEEDVSIVQSLFGGLDGDLSPEVGQELLSRFAELTGKFETQQKEADDADRDAAMAKLRGAWGAFFHANLSQLRRAIDSQPFADDFADARLPDGRLLWNQPEVARWIFNLLKGGNTMSQQHGTRRQAAPNRQALEREKHEIQEVMRQDRAKYNRDERMQARYVELIELLGSEG